MPTLHWIGKEKVLNHHRDVPFRVLDHQYGFRSGEGESKTPTNSGNKIIHGDNLEALKALLPEYEGKINCIYIDPPYNTGNENWIYNDNLNDPKFKKWLGKIVGKEGEDLSRHDKWLCMMYPRMMLLHKLLADDGGIIFVSIDDNELSNLKLLMDEIFGLSNFIEYFSWVKTSTPPSLAKKSRKTIEYVLCYEKKKNNKKYQAEEGDGSDAPLINSGNALVELVFPRKSLYFKIADGTYPSGAYDKVVLNKEIKILNGFSEEDVILTGEFKWTQDTLTKEVNKGTSFIIKSEKFSIRYLRESDTFKAPTNLLKEKYISAIIDKKEAGVETNEGAKKELFDIFDKKIFDYPKPSSLIEFFLRFMTNKNGVVLDSFAGSGTTAHSVISLNKKDNGNRKFILIEMEDYAKTITAERIKRVLNGFKSNAPIMGSFDFYSLGGALFNESGLINIDIEIEKIRSYIYYTETNTFLSKKEDVENKYFLDTQNSTAYYLFFEPNKTTTLNHDFLSTIKTKAEQYIIYADNCTLTKDYLLRHNIIFKKIPRDITLF